MFNNLYRKVKYEIIAENDIGVLLKNIYSGENEKNICFVQHSSFEKYVNKKNTNYGVLCKCKYAYISKRLNNSTIVEHAKNLINFFKDINIKNISLVAVSYGGLIAALATNDNIVNKVVLFQSPLWGTPLADYNNWDKFSNHVRKYLSKRYKKELINVYLNDLTNGLNGKWDLIKPNKITFIYGYSIRIKGLVSLYNRLWFYPEIKKVCNMENDAVVPFPDRRKIEKIGFNKIIYLRNIYHICTILRKYHLMLLKEVNNYNN